MKYFIVTFFILLTGCSDPLKDYLDNKYPPIDRREQQTKAINSLKKSMSNMDLPSVSIGVSLKEIENIISSDENLKRFIESVDISSDKQLLDISMNINTTLTQSDWSKNDEINKVLGGSEITVAAKLSVGVGIASEIEGNGSSSEYLSLRLVPVFDELKISSLKVKGKATEETDISKVGDSIAWILRRYSENVTGYINMLSFMKTKLSTNIIDSSNPSGIIKAKGDEALNMFVSLSSGDLSSPLKLGNVAFLIDENYLSAMIELIPTRSEYTPTVSKELGSYDDAKKLFSDTHEEVFGTKPNGSNMWVGLTKSSIALSTNSVVNQSKACFKVRSNIPTEKFKEKIDLPDETSIDCTSERDCRQDRDCNVSKSHDRRDCRACLLRRPWDGGCVQRGNDPFCEAAKAAQNAIYEADYAARKLDCERIKEQNRLVCEGEKATEKGLCEAGKEIVKRISRTGNVANIEGYIQGVANSNICFTNIGVSEDLSNINISLLLEGNAEIDGKLEIVPLDIVGHLVCQMPSNSTLDFDLSIPKHNQTAELDVEFKEDEGVFGLEFIVNEMVLPVRLSPSPTEWILTNLDLTLKCQGLNLIKPLIVAANPFVPELRGLSEHKQPKTTVFIPINLPEQEVGGNKVRSKLKVTNSAIFLISVKD